MTNKSYSDIVKSTIITLSDRQLFGIENDKNGKNEEQIICDNFNGEMKEYIKTFCCLKKIGKFNKYPGRTKTDIYANIGEIILLNIK